ncbi:MAG: chorismate-binding protein [Maribacter sp.]|nr:chorismate-binding protein [Maribacter sp.]
MFSELMKKVEGQLSKELPFVVYRKPNSKEIIGILQHNNKLNQVLDYSEKGFVFAPFNDDSPAILMPLDELIATEYKATTSSGHTGDTNLKVDTPDMDFHINLVQKGVQEIKKGKFNKVVLSRKLSVDCLDTPSRIFERLISQYTSAFCYLWYHPKIGIWLGATPEILVRVENNRLTTMSLAGTKAYIKNEEPRWGQKELDEQQIVTTYIADALKDKVSSYKVHEVESVKAGNLWHLRTKITAVVHKNLGLVLNTLHPTPAVCGLPLASSRKFILEHENYPREFYTGFLGELNFKKEIVRAPASRNQENKSYRAIKTKTELFVNLRCMQMNGKKAIIYVGGGITKDSVPENEWLETIEKSKTILSILSQN